MPTQTETQKANALAATGFTQEQLDQASDAGQPIISRATPTITADTLQQPVNALQPPNAPESTVPVRSDFSDLIARATAVDPREAELAREQGQLEDIVGQGGRADFRTAREDALGVTAKRESATKFAGRLTQLQAEEDTLEERLQASVRGRGVTEGGLRPTRTAQQRDLAVRKRFAAADLLVAQGDLQGALDQVNTAISDEFADREDAVTAQQSRVDFLKDAIARGDVKETNALNIRLAEREAQIAEDKAQIETEKLEKTEIFELAVQARAAGADDITVRSIQRGTLDEARSISTPFLTQGLESQQLQQDLQNRLLGQQLESEALEQQKLLKEIEGLGAGVGIPQAAFGTPEHAQGVILGSSQFGNNRLNDSRLEKLDQAELALGGVESLNALLFQGDDGVDLTGVVKGRVRTLTTALGGDAPAASINALIQGLIPTVARGIFGEVGVLTDADINNYKKTIANLNSSEAQNRLVSIIMMDVLSRSYESTLLNSARNQTNVSGFAPAYLDIKRRIANEKAKLGVTAFTQSSDEDLLDSVPTSGFDSLSQPFTSQFTSFMNNSN